MAAFVTVIRETLMYSSSSEDLSILDQSHLRTNSHSCHVSLSREYLYYLLSPPSTCTRIRIFLNPQHFLSGYDFRPHPASGEFGSKSGYFFNLLSRVELK